MAKTRKRPDLHYPTTRKNTQTRRYGRIGPNGVKYAFKAEVNNGIPALRTRTGKGIDLRTLPGKRYVATIEALVNQLGGRENVSAAEFELICRAAMLSVDLSFQDAEALGRPGDNKGRVNPSVYIPMVEAQRRVLQALGLKRRARDITASLAKVIEGRAVEVDDDG